MMRAVCDRITARDGNVVLSANMDQSTDSDILTAMSPGVTELEARGAGRQPQARWCRR